MSAPPTSFSSVEGMAWWIVALPGLAATSWTKDLMIALVAMAVNCTASARGV